MSLSLSVIDRERTGSSKIYFTVNYPPSLGSFTVYPSEGKAMEEFVLEAGTGWFDLNIPLSYQFFWFDGRFWQPLTEILFVTSKTVRLPIGSKSENFKLKLKLIISDASGAKSEAFAEVRVTEPSVETAVMIISSFEPSTISASVTSSRSE